MVRGLVLPSGRKIELPTWRNTFPDTALIANRGSPRAITARDTRQDGSSLLYMCNN